VLVERDGQSVNGKSIMGVLMLAAGKGSEVQVSCEGADAEDAMSSLARLIEAGFGER
jgi:phosphocarrier protein